MPGATVPEGASGPEARRRCTVTDSGAVPGLKTSISEEPPVTSWLWGIDQCDSGRAPPARGPGPADDPANTCTSDATTRPVLVATTVLTVDDVLHLGRHVLHLDLARLEHDPLVVDRVHGARRRDEGEVDHDRASTSG